MLKRHIKISQNLIKLGGFQNKAVNLRLYVCSPRLPLKVLAALPKKDYPVLNTRLFVDCWLGYALDKSLTSMRDLFRRLNSKDLGV